MTRNLDQIICYLEQKSWKKTAFFQNIQLFACENILEFKLHIQIESTVFKVSHNTT